MEQPVYKSNNIKASAYNLIKNLSTDKCNGRLLGITVSNLLEIEDEFANITIFEYINKRNEATK